MEYKATLNGIFSEILQLKAHLSDVEIWHNKLIKYFLIELYKLNPDPYYEKKSGLNK